MQRRTRIVATLGPATDRPGILETLLQEGLDVARINFSHGSAAEHEERISRLRRLTEPLSRPVAVLLDLPGPKFRVLLEAPLPLSIGQETALGITPDAAAPIRVTEPEALAGLQPEHRVLLDDGRLQLRVLGREGDVIRLRVTSGGTLLPKKGINCPDTALALPTITPCDREALDLAAKVGVDWLALSFVRSAAAAAELREETKRRGLPLPILAKIEKPEAVKHAREIIDAFDGMMVARGDLGVEVALERVPHMQKHLIGLARAAGKPVITATDMLDSMRANPRPTRAEASDVANAVYDGSDAVMLSGETAAGQYPVEAFRTMDRIVRETEIHLRDAPPRDIVLPGRGIEDHLTHVACALARDIRADAILCPAMSGRTVRLVARHRPRIPLIVAVRQPVLARQLALVWGLTLVSYLEEVTVQDRLARVILSAFRPGAVHAGQLVVVLAGHPEEAGPRTPALRVARVGPSGNPLDPETA